MHKNRTLIRGDNLEEMRKFPDACVDLIATDPPFNSKRDYFVPYRDEHGEEPDSLITAFTDTWKWGESAEEAYNELIAGVGGQVGETIEGFRQFLNDTPMMAYLVMMAIRFVEMHRILKSIGSLYLHCDPTASHYLKIVLDAVFGSNNFRNEIVWQRTYAHGDGNQFGRVHDIILFYSKSQQTVWNPIFTAHDPEYIKKSYRHEDERGSYRVVTLNAAGVSQGESGQPWRGVNPTAVGRHWAAPGRNAWPKDIQFPENYNSLSVHEKLDVLDAHELIYWPPKGKVPQFKRYLSTSKGRRVHDIITDIYPLANQAKERTSYPTQKPIELYKRFIAASSNENNLILDPFCGCGTTLMAAEELERQWIGIDLTYLATGAVKLQIEKFFPQLRNDIIVTGTPENEQQALQLASTDPQGFEEWCVTHVLKFKSNAKKVGDGGIDGTYRFPIGRIKGKQAYGKGVAQIKGGNYTLGHIRDFRTAMADVDADLGIFVVTKPPTDGMRSLAAKELKYEHPFTKTEYPGLQIYQIQDYFEDKFPTLPPAEKNIL